MLVLPCQAGELLIQPTKTFQVYSLTLLKSPNQQKTKMTSRPTTTVDAKITKSSISPGLKYRGRVEYSTKVRVNGSSMRRAEGRAHAITNWAWGEPSPR